MSVSENERCPGCGQGYLYTIGHTGEGEMRWCFMCSRGFSVPEGGLPDEQATTPDQAASIVAPTPAQAAAREATNDPEQAASRADVQGGGQ